MCRNGKNDMDISRKSFLIGSVAAASAAPRVHAAAAGQRSPTFAEPTLPPKGIKAVILAGETAVLDGRIVNGRLGKPIRKQR